MSTQKEKATCLIQVALCYVEYIKLFLSILEKFMNLQRMVLANNSQIEMERANVYVRNL